MPHAQFNAEKEIMDYFKLRTVKHVTWEKNDAYKIHFEKFNDWTLQFFKKLGLAVHDKSLEWVFVERNTYFLYMAILAKNLADIDPNLTITSTDNVEYEQLAFERTMPKKGFPSLRINFREILPSPVFETPIESIIKFRKERHNELLSFREVIDSFQQEVSNEDSYEEIKEVMVQSREKIERERARLNESLRDSKINSFFSTTRTLIDIKSPSLWETITLAIGSNVANLPSWLGTVIIAGTAAIQVGSSVLEKRSETAAKIRESPFSYLYLAEKNKIIQKLSPKNELN